MMYCNQSGCEHVAAFRFTWPGRKEAGVCALHSCGLANVAEAMGLPLELIPIPEVWGAMFTPDEGEASKIQKLQSRVDRLILGLEAAREALRPNSFTPYREAAQKIDDLLAIVRKEQGKS